MLDWEGETASMHTVYTNSLLNIAATGAADSSVVFSFERNPLAHRPFRASVGSIDPQWVFP